jgi:hypothetical protein
MSTQESTDQNDQVKKGFCYKCKRGMRPLFLTALLDNEFAPLCEACVKICKQVRPEDYKKWCEELIRDQC